MDDPALMTAMGAPWNLPIPAESEKIRKYLYINMWISFWVGSYNLGELTDIQVRNAARNELFRSSAGREYWVAIRKNVMSADEGKYHRFARIINAEYEKAIASGVPVNDPVRVTGHANNAVPLAGKEFWYSLPISAALIVGVLAGWRLNGHSNKGAP